MFSFEMFCKVAHQEPREDLRSLHHQWTVGRNDMVGFEGPPFLRSESCQDSCPGLFHGAGGLHGFNPDQRQTGDA